MGIIGDNKGIAEELARFSRLCYDRHLVGAAGGNLSVRVQSKDVFLVTASGVSLRDVSPENIVAVDGSGNILESPSGLKPSKETGFHLSIFMAKSDVNAVIHVHPAFATVFAIRKKQIPLATVSAGIKLKQGPVVPEAHPGSQELCDNITRAVKESSSETTILLMERHGLIAYNTTLCKAFDDAELAEDTAKIAFLLSQSGQFED